MPLIGWLLSDWLGDTFRSVDHWIAFLLLAFLGWRMLSEALSPTAEKGVGQHSRRLRRIRGVGRKRAQCRFGGSAHQTHRSVS